MNLSNCWPTTLGVILVSTLVTSLGGCGYRTGFTTVQGVKSIWVPIFVNRTLRREMEYPLTQSVIRRLQQHTGVNVVFRRGQAEASLYGEITGYGKSVLSESAQDEVLEASITIDIHLRLVDNRTGKVLVQRTLRDTQAFLAARDESESSARERAFDDLAQKILYSLEAWE